MFKPHYCFPDSHQLSTTWPAFDPSAQRSPSIHLICSAEARFSPQQTAEIPTCVLLWWESKNGDRDVFVRDNRKLMCKKCWESFHVWPLPFWGAEKNADTPRVLRGRHVGLGWPTRINNRVFDQWHPGVQESGSIGSFGGRQIRGKKSPQPLLGGGGKYMIIRLLWYGIFQICFLLLWKGALSFLEITEQILPNSWVQLPHRHNNFSYDGLWCGASRAVFPHHCCSLSISLSCKY